MEYFSKKKKKKEIMWGRMSVAVPATSALHQSQTLSDHLLIQFDSFPPFAPLDHGTKAAY